MAGAGLAGVCSAAGAKKAAIATPQIGAATADSAGALSTPRRSARTTTCTQSEPAARGGDR